MGEQRWSAVDRYFTDLLLPADAALEEAEAAARAAGLPMISVSPPQGRLLQLLARTVRARSILEIGTLAGYSAIWLARALPEGGRLITLEADPHHAEVARANIANAGLGDLVDVRVGPAMETLPGLDGPFDLIFIDADKPGYPDYLRESLRLARPGALIVADNVVRGGEVIESGSPDPTVRGVRRFNELVAKEPRLMATALQTVGLKGYDGLAIALVTG